MKRAFEMRRRKVIALSLAALLLGALPLLATSVAAPGRAPAGVRFSQHLLTTSRGQFRVLEWAPQHTGQRLPLILYAPGWGDRAEVGSAQLGALASRGYVAIAFDDLSADPLPARKDAAGADLGGAGFDMSTPAALQASYQLAGRRVDLAARKGRAILDAIMASPEFADRIDPARIGFLGYSFGGATGAEQSLADPRIKAVVNLDGWLFGQAAATPPRKPYLLFYSREDFPPRAYLSSTNPAELALARGCAFDQALHLPLKAGADFYWLAAMRSGHRDLNGQPENWHWRKPLAAMGGEEADLRARQQAQLAVIAGFFDRYLKGEQGALPRPGGSYPADLVEVTKQQLLGS